MNGMMLVLLFVILLPVGMLVTIIPYLTRRTESFGVTIDAKYFADPQIRQLRRSYSFMTGLISLLVLLGSLFAVYALGESGLNWVLPLSLTCLLAVHAVLYLKYHFLMKKMKQSRKLVAAEGQRVVIETGFHREKRTTSMLWVLPSLLLAAITAWMGIAYYESFPDQLIMQWDFQGNPTTVVNKSYITVLGPVMAQLLIIGTFWLSQLGIAYSKQQIDAANPHRSLQQNLIFRRKWSAFLWICSFLLTLLFALIALQMLLGFAVNLLLGYSLAVVAYILIESLRLGIMTGQGGSRIPVEKETEATGTGSRDDDRYWKLGVFYFNPQDPTLFLEKRFGIGWTLNFARPLAWVILITPLLLALVISILL